MSETPSGLYDVFETPSGKFRRWHSSQSIECLNGDVWQSIPDVAQAEITRLRAALEGERGWQPIETAPKDGVTCVLIATFKTINPCIQSDIWNVHGTAPDGERTGWWWGWGSGQSYNKPTHWRPLPLSPGGPMTDKAPWAHVAIQDGYWCGVISDRVDSPKLEKSWRKEVAKFCGDHIADGGQIITVYSREEYDQTMKYYPMIPSDWKKKAKKSDTPQMSLFP